MFGHLVGGGGCFQGEGLGVFGGRSGVFSGRRTRSVWWEEWGVFREED